MNQDPIYEVQEYLRFLAKNGYPLPLVIPDGIYGAETRGAVSVFQGLVSLPVTGRVDYATWQALVSAYETAKRITDPSLPIYPFEEVLSDRKVSEGDRFLLVYIIQVILQTISAFWNIEQQAITGIYDAQTVSNIRAFQRANGLTETGEVDRLTWDRLARAYNKYLNRAI